MRNRLVKWLMVSCAAFIVLAGCRMSPSAPSMSAAPSESFSVPASPSATPAAPVESPSSYAEASIVPADDVHVDGTAPLDQLDAYFFADSATGWLITEEKQNNLTLLHSKDGGRHWEAKTTLPGEHGDAVYFAGEKNGFAWVRTDCEAGGDGEERCGQQLLHTVDGGDRWTAAWASSDKKASFAAAAFAFPGGEAGYALTRQGMLLVSRDGGKSWKAIAVGSDAAFRIEHMRFISSSTGWVVGKAEHTDSDGQRDESLEVWRTQDAGAHWKRQFQQTGVGLVESGGIDFYDERNGYFLLGDYDAMTGRIMRTTDGGSHWEAAGPLQPARPTPVGIRLTSASSGWIPLSSGAGPVEGGLLHLTGGSAGSITRPDGVWSLRDAVPTGGGTGWAVADVMPGARAAVLQIADDGDSWRQVWPQPRPAADVQFIDRRMGYGVARESEPGAFMATEDGGVTWDVVSDLGVSGVRLYFADRQHGWVLGTKDQGTKPVVLETTDGGKTWRTTSSSLPDWPSIPESLDLEFFGETDGNLLVHNGNEVRVLRTMDAGKSWQVQAVFPQDNVLLAVAFAGERNLRQLELMTERDKTTWLAFSKFELDGQSVTPLAKLPIDGTPMGILPLSDQVTAVITYRFSGGRFETHLQISQDGGSHWSDHAFTEAGLDWSTLQRFGAADDTFWWLLVDGHLLRTYDGGSSWTVIY